MVKNQKRQFLGIWIPRAIYLNKDLTWTEKILLVEIHSLDNEQGCFASNDYFAEFLSCTTTTISTSVSKLKRLGFIKQTSFDGRTRILKTDIKKFKSEGLKKFKGRQQENLNHNNTDNNTINKNKKIDKKVLIVENKNNAVCIDVENLKDNHAWLENVSIHLKIATQTTSQLLKEFVSEQKLKDDSFKSLKDTKSHFLNWAKIQVNKGRKYDNSWGRPKQINNQSPKKQDPKIEISPAEKRKMHKSFIMDNLFKPYKQFCDTGHYRDIKDYGGIITTELKKYKLLFDDKNVISKIKNEINNKSKLKSNTNTIGSILKINTKQISLSNEILKLTFKNLKKNKINLEKTIQL